MAQKARPWWQCQEYLPPLKVSPPPAQTQPGHVLWGLWNRSSSLQHPDQPGASAPVLLGNDYQLNQIFFLTPDVF